MLNFIIFFQA
uniref:Uncharacterized protein n=1 Tax=Lepeophtheirus salmonis TaxID=72036 RepID=A0A0K2UN63_LEPSM